MLKNTTMKNRVRSSNFTLFEEDCLVSLASKHSMILECKKSDHAVWEAKDKVWKEIQEKFTAATGNNREIQNLKNKYENLKRKTKKIEGDMKKDLFQTGGGASLRAKPSATHNILLGILGTSAVGLPNPFDADKPGKPLIKKFEDSENIIIVNNDNVDNDNLGDVIEYVDVNMESETEGLDVSIVPTKTTAQEKKENVPMPPTWAKWNPEVLKTQTSAELTTPLSKKKKKYIKTTLGESVKKYSTEKVELIEHQKLYFINKEKRAQEKHDTEQLRAREKHEWERVHHELTIEKLRLEIKNLKKSKYNLRFNFN